MTTLLSRTSALVAVATLLVSAACGGSEAPTVAEDRALAERIVLTSADLPGFEREPKDDQDDTAGSIDDCLNGNPMLTAEDNPRSVDGDDFSKDDGNVRVQSGAVVAVKKAEAEKAFADFRDALAGQCVRDGLRKAILDDADPGLVVRDITAAPLPVPDVADEAVGTRLTIPLEVGRERISAYVDMTFLRRGRVLAGLFTFQAGTAFPDGERDRLTGLLGARLDGKAKNTPDVGPAPTTTVAPAPTTTAGRSSTTAASGEYVRFRDPSGVSFEHPRTWTVEPSRSGSPIIIFIDPASGVPFRRNINILLQGGPTPFTLEDYTKTSLDQIRGLEGVTVGESRSTTLGGTPGHRLAYRGDLGSGDLRFLGVWTVRGGKAWLVTYSADPARYNAGLPEVERLLTSMQLPA